MLGMLQIKLLRPLQIKALPFINFSMHSLEELKDFYHDHTAKFKIPDSKFKTMEKSSLRAISNTFFASRIPSKLSCQSSHQPPPLHRPFRRPRGSLEL